MATMGRARIGITVSDAATELKIDVCATSAPAQRLSRQAADDVFYRHDGLLPRSATVAFDAQNVGHPADGQCKLRRE